MANEDKIVTSLKHYQRRDKFSKTKELVSELVRDGSETADFLHRMEARRRATSCKQSLDMRGRVAGECARIVHNGMIHYLDAQSLVIFNKELKKNGGVFTKGYFDDIRNADHTHGAKHRKEKQQLQQRVKTGLNTKPEELTNNNAIENLTSRVTHHPVSIIPFGYYRKRQEGRLTYASKVNVHYGEGEVFNASTVDISLHGLKLSSAILDVVNVDDTVGIEFTDLIKDHGLDCSGPIPYILLGTNDNNGKRQWRLRQAKLEAHPEIDHFISDFIENNYQRYKYCVEDVMLTVQVSAYERMYLRSLLHVPLFIGPNATSEMELRFISISDHNEHQLNPWKSANSQDHDLSPLLPNQRLNALIKAESQETLIYCFKVKQGTEWKWFTAAEFEFSSIEQRRLFCRIGMAFETWCVYKLRLEPAVQLDQKKLDRILAPLKQKSAPEAENLINHIKGLQYLGLLWNITSTMGEAAGASGTSSLDGHQAILAPFCAQQWQTGKFKYTQLGYRLQRSEPRYIHATEMEIFHRGKTIQGQTVDFSLSGIKLSINSPISCRKGDAVLVSLNETATITKDETLFKMSYEIVEIEQEGLVLRLERAGSAANHPGTTFFKRVIKMNQDKLEIDLNDDIETAKTQLHEGLISETLMSVPFFIHRGENRKLQINKIAASENTESIIWFFRLHNGEYDFSPLAREESIKLISKEFANLDKKLPQRLCFDLYMYKSHSTESGEEFIVSASSLELATNESKEAFIKQAISAEEYCFAQVSICKPITTRDSEVDEEVELIRQNSRHRADVCYKELTTVQYIGNLTDITNEVKMEFSL